MSSQSEIDVSHMCNADSAGWMQSIFKISYLEKMDRFIKKVTMHRYMSELCSITQYLVKLKSDELSCN